MTYADHGNIADIFRRHLENAESDDVSYNALTGALDDIANYCQKDNPKFDRDKFMIAAGIRIV